MKTTSDIMRAMLAAMYRNEAEGDDVGKALTKLGAAALAELIVDAFNRGILTRSFLGIDEDGALIDLGTPSLGQAIAAAM